MIPEQQQGGTSMYVNILRGMSYLCLFEKASKAELSLCFSIWVLQPQDADICQGDAVLQ